MFPLCRFTGLRHGKRAVEIPQLQIEQQHVEAPEIQTSESLKSAHVRQVASTGEVVQVISQERISERIIG